MTPTPSSDLAGLVRGAAALGISLDEQAQASFVVYDDLLLRWSSRFNLLGPAAIRELWSRHFLDSLTLVLALPSEAGIPERSLRVLDVGSGAGLPGIPLAIAFPGWQVTLLEATGKKAQFLETAAHELGMANLTVLAGRAETLAHDPAHREAYGLCVARGVAAAAALLELTLPFVYPGGHAIFYKGQHDLSEELQAAEPARVLLGAATPFITPSNIVPGDARCLVRYAKQTHTPAALPRRPGVPEHHPLSVADAASSTGAPAAMQERRGERPGWG